MTEPQANPLSSLDYQGLPVLHLFHQYHSVGGVESVLRLHRHLDSKIGVESDLIIYSDDVSSSGDRLHCLGINSSQSIHSIGRKLRSITSPRAGRIAIYHLPWGFSYFGPNDLSSRRILIIHTQSPDMEDVLRKNSQFLDGILCVNHQMISAVRASTRPELSDRIAEIGCPIDPPRQSRPDQALSNPVRLGFSGRLEIKQKRIDRIPEFCTALHRLDVPYQLDILGDGSDRPLLEEKGAIHKLVFRGVLHGADYWQRLREMDCIVFFSDYEGTPLSLLEALSQGVIPIYPHIRTGGDPYVEKVLPELLYAPGDLEAAARIVQKLRTYSPAAVADLRQRCREAVESRSVSNYFKQLFDFSRRIQDLPRISISSARPTVRLFQFMSLDQLNAIRKLGSTLRK